MSQPIFSNHPCLAQTFHPDDLVEGPFTQRLLFTPTFAAGDVEDWDTLSDDYFQWQQHYPLHHWPLHTRAPELRHRLQHSSTALAVELGCGTGWWSLRYSLQHSSWLVWALDRRPSRLQLGKRLLAGALQQSRVEFFHSENLPFLTFVLPERSVDLLTVFYPNPFVEERHRHKRFYASPELLRAMVVLRPLGKLLVTCDQKDFLLRVAANLVHLDPDGELTCASFGPPDWPATSARTAFEAKYLAQGRRLYQLVFKRSALEIKKRYRTPLEESALHG